METKQFNALMQVIAKLSSAVAELSSAVDGLRKDVDQLRKDVDGLRNDVDGLRSDMVVLRSDMERGFTELRADMERGFAEVRAEAVAESKAQAAVHAEILQAFNAPFLTLEQDHVATKTSHGKRISKLERHIS